MTLFAKAQEFETLCSLITKEAQTKVDPNTPFVFRQEIPAASLSGPTPHYSVRNRAEETEQSPQKPVAQTQPAKPAQPVRYISKEYYNLLGSLGQIAATLTNRSNLLDLRQKAKEQYNSLKSKIQELRNYLAFQDATVSSMKALPSQAQKNAAVVKERELNAFKAKLDRSVGQIETALVDFAGNINRDIAGPDPNQAPTFS